jgi:hypothetical protein
MHSSVSFEFLHPKPWYDCVTGAVIVKGGRMTLTFIQDGYKYILDGYLRGGHYEGEGKGFRARWADIGDDTFVGIWEEEMHDYHFSFRLTKPYKVSDNK